MRIDVKKLQKKTVTKHANACYSMAVHLSMQLFRKDSMNVMRISVECLELVYTLLNTVRRVINTFMALAVELVVHRTKINHVIHVQGNILYLWQKISSQFNIDFKFEFKSSDNCCCVVSHLESHFFSSVP